MRRYFIKSLGSLIHLLIAQGILAFDPAWNPDNQLAHLNQNLAPRRETPTPGRIAVHFDLNEYPPSESIMVSLSSTWPKTLSEHTLSRLREHPEQNLVLSTSESIPHQLSSPSSLKRKKATKPYVKQMKDIRQRVSEQHGHVAYSNGMGFPHHLTAPHSQVQVTTKKPAGLLEYTRPSRGNNIRGPAPAHQEKEHPLLANNWDYVKLDLNIEGIPDHIHAKYSDSEQIQKEFIDYMHSTHPYLPYGKTLWIPMDLMTKFRDRYRQVRTNHPYPKKVTFAIRQLGTRDIMLKIAEDKLHVDSCWSSLGDITTQLKQSIGAKGPTAQFLLKITKLSVAMSVLYFTLFREYEERTLSQSHVSSMVAFIRDAITSCSKKPVPEGFPESEEKLRKILHNFKSKSKYNAPEETKMAWNIFEYWLTINHTPSQTSPTYDIADMHEVINKIIFYLNYKYFMLRASAHEMKKKKKNALKAT